MPPDLTLARELLKDPRYPRTAKYDPDWLVSLEMGNPTFWLLEMLCQAMDLQPGMRVLDLGCGKAGGSIFLAKEFGVQVWSVDLQVSPTENWQRICQAGLENQIFPLRADARSLPFADQFFDAMIGVNSLFFFATEDLYLRFRLINLVKPDGQFGIVVPGFYHDFEGDLPTNLPEYLKRYWDACILCSWHSAEWWRQHWLKTNLVDVALADNFPDDEGYQTYLRWEKIIQYPEKIAQDDAGRNITFVRLVARRKS
jgi:cyclopropane fatty-acyl-phospholipid synthase-like methyltransferase